MADVSDHFEFVFRFGFFPIPFRFVRSTCVFLLLLCSRLQYRNSWSHATHAYNVEAISDFLLHTIRFDDDIFMGFKQFQNGNGNSIRHIFNTFRLCWIDCFAKLFVRGGCVYSILYCALFYCFKKCAEKVANFTKSS